MRSRRRAAVLRTAVRFGALLALSLGVLSTTTVQPAAGDSSPEWSFNWLGQTPSSPTPWNPTSWDVTVHSRDIDTLQHLDPMMAQHGADCSPPPATHPTSSYQDAVFICAQHMMTAINADGYGAIYLTPNHMMDFSGGIGSTLKFSVSTERTSQRDWWDLWITPFQENLVLPLQMGLPDLSGPPRDALHIIMVGEDRFTAELYRNCLPNGACAEQDLPVATADTWDSRVPPSERTRTPFELDLTQSHVRFGIPSANLWWINTAIPGGGLPFDQGLVQVGHHSYTPTKDAGCGPPAGVPQCEPNTWHWSDFSISRAVGFTMIRPDTNTAHQGVPTVTLPVAAPAGSFLRFVGLGTVRVSFDGAAPVQPRLQVQAGNKGDGITDPSQYANYWMPIPAGTTTVKFSGQDWWGGPWWVEGVDVWNPAPDAVTLPAAAPSPAAQAVEPSAAPAPSAAPKHAASTSAPAPGLASRLTTAVTSVPFWPLTLPLALLVLVAAGGCAYGVYRYRFLKRVTTPPTPPSPPGG